MRAPSYRKGHQLYDLFRLVSVRALEIHEAAPACLMNSVRTRDAQLQWERKYHRNIFESFSKVFENLRKSSVIFENFRKFSDNFQEHWPSEQFWKIFGNLRKVVGNLRNWKIIKIPSLLCLYDKKNSKR